jgi:3-hydroxyisobutyrate dehydrogenase
MGQHMATHLAEAGHHVSAYDIRPSAALALKETTTIEPAATVADAARGAEAVFTSLPGPPEVEVVVEGPGGLREAMQPGSVYVDLSTNSPTLVRRLSASLAEKGISILDAPVSGGVEGAEAGTLSVIVGGPRETFDRMQPALKAIGTKVFYCGESGAGCVVKLCNNILGATYGIILSEALTLGVKAGVDLRTLSDVISVSTGTNARLAGHLQRYLFKRNFEPGFSTALSIKDTRLALELAREYDVPMQLATMVEHETEAALERGWADLDFDAVMRLQEERAGVILEAP